MESNTTTYKKTQENSSLDLLKCYDSLSFKKLTNSKNFKVENCSKSNLINILRELYKRIIIPLYIPVFILISMCLILITKESQNFLKMKFLIFIVGFLTILFSETTLRFIKSDLMKNIDLILLPIVLIMIIYLTIILKHKKI